MKNTKEERVKEIIKDVNNGKGSMIGINQDIAEITKKDDNFIIYRNNINAVIFQSKKEEDLVKYLMISLTL